MARDDLNWQRDGAFWHRDLLDDDALSALEHAIAARDATGPGARLALNAPLARVLEQGGAIMSAAEALMPTARPVRALVFDKGLHTNWQVPWHQDRIIAVAERVDLSGFGPWSRKGGVWHVEPPADLLAAMMFARVHLDDQDAADGAMEIALGTAAQIVPAAEAARRAAGAERVSTSAGRGNVLFLRALTLHRSRPSTSGRQRRVLRIDFAAVDLPAPLEWAYRPDRPI